MELPDVLLLAGRVTVEEALGEQLFSVSKMTSLATSGERCTGVVLDEDSSMEEGAGDHSMEEFRSSASESGKTLVTVLLI